MDSTCPTAAADTNHDGIIELAETEPAAGVTMILLNAAPADLTIAPRPGTARRDADSVANGVCAGGRRSGADAPGANAAGLSAVVEAASVT